MIYKVLAILLYSIFMGFSYIAYGNTLQLYIKGNPTHLGNAGYSAVGVCLWLTLMFKNLDKIIKNKFYNDLVYYIFVFMYVMFMVFYVTDMLYVYKTHRNNDFLLLTLGMVLCILAFIIHNPRKTRLR